MLRSGRWFERLAFVLTLPNILKVFNPNLYGYAEANTLAKIVWHISMLPNHFTITQDMPYMAEVWLNACKPMPK
ncbi:hypothetical protein EVAR_100935_1 [Eumeta japonica]|uniref:Uncharacterized protein n=1 Tax=Eumeta variegata TaxID=151549 RepID=A0A4C2A246_EUMVA|nr:hypothetical protein EVAR_100935_1 [Eumeta japonica]